MGHTNDQITLYTAQAPAVREAIRRDGACFSREEYVAEKYQESAPIFLTAYRWFAEHAQAIVPRPAGAQFPYWAFADPCNADTNGGAVIKLQVPRDQVGLFDLYDWNKILQLRYMGEDERQEKEFRQQLAQRGLREDQVVLSRFYPQLRQQILDSWDRLFRHHSQLLAGNTEGVGGVQAGLWQIRQEWCQAYRPDQGPLQSAGGRAPGAELA